MNSQLLAVLLTALLAGCIAPGDDTPDEYCPSPTEPAITLGSWDDGQVTPYMEGDPIWLEFGLSGGFNLRYGAILDGMSPSEDEVLGWRESVLLDGEPFRTASTLFQEWPCTDESERTIPRLMHVTDPALLSRTFEELEELSGLDVLLRVQVVDAAGNVVSAEQSLIFDVAFE